VNASKEPAEKPKLYPRAIPESKAVAEVSPARPAIYVAAAGTQNRLLSRLPEMSETQHTEQGAKAPVTYYHNIRKGSYRDNFYYKDLLNYKNRFKKMI